MGTITSNNATRPGYVQPKTTSTSLSAANQYSYTDDRIITKQYIAHDVPAPNASFSYTPVSEQIRMILHEFGSNLFLGKEDSAPKLTVEYNLKGYVPVPVYRYLGTNHVVDDHGILVGRREQDAKVYEVVAWILPYRDPEEGITTNYKSRSGEATKTAKAVAGASLSRDPSADEEALRDTYGSSQDLDIEEGVGIKTEESISQNGKKSLTITNDGVVGLTALTTNGKNTTLKGDVTIRGSSNVSVTSNEKNKTITIEGRTIEASDGIKVTPSEPGQPLKWEIKNTGVLGLTITDPSGLSHTCKGSVIIQGGTSNIKFTHSKMGDSDVLTLKVTWL